MRITVPDFRLIRIAKSPLLVAGFLLSGSRVGAGARLAGWFAFDPVRTLNLSESRRSTSELTGWRGFIAPVRVE
jgi:hypothetical protein